MKLTEDRLRDIVKEVFEDWGKMPGRWKKAIKDKEDGWKKTIKDKEEGWAEENKEEDEFDVEWEEDRKKEYQKFKRGQDSVDAGRRFNRTYPSDKAKRINKMSEAKLKKMVESFVNEPENNDFNAETMEDLIFSLAWAGHSAHHSENVRNILKSFFPEKDWKQIIKRFLDDRDSPPGPGSPK